MAGPERVVADVGALVSGGAATVSWLTTVNEILHVAATLVAIVAGLASAYFYFTRARALKRDKRADTDG